MSETLRALAIACIASSVLAYDYSVAKVDQLTHQQRMRTHHEVTIGAAESPYRYRVLVPIALDPVIRLAATVMNPESAFKRVYGAFYFVALVLMLYLMHVYLRTWFSEQQSFTGILIIGCTLPIAMRQHFFAPWSLVEPSFLILGLLLIHQERLRGLIPLTLIATLNRETAVLIPIACVMFALLRRPVLYGRLWLGTALTVASLALSGALRWVLGAGVEAITLPAIWSINSSHEGFWSAVGNIVLFTGGVGWILIWRGYRRAPWFVRQQAWLAVIYLPLFAVWGIWYEVRLLMPLYPFLIPTLLAGLSGPVEGRRPDGSRPAPSRD